MKNGSPWILGAGFDEIQVHAQDVTDPKCPPRLFTQDVFDLRGFEDRPRGSRGREEARSKERVRCASDELAPQWVGVRFRWHEHDPRRKRPVCLELHHGLGPALEIRDDDDAHRHHDRMDRRCSAFDLDDRLSARDKRASGRAENPWYCSSMVDVAHRRATYAEYMAFSETSELKHEYISGEIVAMAGGTIAHGRLISQVTGLVRDGLRGRPCIVLPAEVRVRIRAADRATYPDLLVVCSAVEADPDDPQAVINPTVIVEVLSDSTADADRGDKFAAYRRLRSLREYVLVSQHERRIDVYTRDGRRWVLDEYRAGEQLRLESIDVGLAVDDVYRDGLGPIIGQ